jgi:phospholipid-binding lipoprotein MlaA
MASASRMILSGRSLNENKDIRISLYAVNLLNRPVYWRACADWHRVAIDRLVSRRSLMPQVKEPFVKRALISSSALVLLAGCATTGTTPGDPYEKFNRKMWSLDESLDRHIAKPVAKGYRGVMPAVLRHGLSNMLENVSEPFTVINCFLQGKPVRGLNAFGRFLINTTIGIGGFRDVASKVGYKATPEDLGQTFAVWGAKKSNYLVLPLYGPSTIRDGLGTLAARWVDPYHIVTGHYLGFWPNAGLTVFEFVDARANLIDSGADSLLETSADSYAVTRSAYLQRRAALIADQDDSDASGAAGDDAALNAALDDLGNGTAPDATAPAGSVPPPVTTPTPDQPQPKPNP